MKHKNAIEINIYDLYDALVLQYGPEFKNDVDCGDLRNIMFGDIYMNDSYKKFYIDEDIPEEEFDAWNGIAPIYNAIITFLQDSFPNHDYVLVDISW